MAKKTKIARIAELLSGADEKKLLEIERIILILLPASPRVVEVVRKTAYFAAKNDK